MGAFEYLCFLALEKLLKYENYNITFEPELLTLKVFKDLYKRDKAGSITLKRVNLYNPLYYLISSYEGYNTSTAAPYWYVRSGLFQNSDILTSSVNLYLALSGYRKIKEVDYQTVWGMGEVKELTDKNIEEIFDWIKFKAQ